MGQPSYKRVEKPEPDPRQIEMFEGPATVAETPAWCRSQAFKDALKKMPATQRDIWEAIARSEASFPGRGMTCEELVWAVCEIRQLPEGTGPGLLTIRPNVTRMKQAGLIEPVKRRGKTESGKACTAYALVDPAKKKEARHD